MMLLRFCRVQQLMLGMLIRWLVVQLVSAAGAALLVTAHSEIRLESLNGSTSHMVLP